MSLGQRIQDARLAAGVSVDDLASLLSVRPGLLRDIENNNFTTCGGDTYYTLSLHDALPIDRKSVV